MSVPPQMPQMMGGHLNGQYPIFPGQQPFMVPQMGMQQMYHQPIQQPMSQPIMHQSPIRPFSMSAAPLSAPSALMNCEFVSLAYWLEFDPL